MRTVRNECIRAWGDVGNFCLFKKKIKIRDQFYFKKFEIFYTKVENHFNKMSRNEIISPFSVLSCSNQVRVLYCSASIVEITIFFFCIIFVLYAVRWLRSPSPRDQFGIMMTFFSLAQQRMETKCMRATIFQLHCLVASVVHAIRNKAAFSLIAFYSLFTHIPYCAVLPRSPCQYVSQSIFSVSSSITSHHPSNACDSVPPPPPPLISSRRLPYLANHTWPQSCTPHSE